MCFSFKEIYISSTQTVIAYRLEVYFKSFMIIEYTLLYSVKQKLINTDWTDPFLQFSTYILLTADKKFLYQENKQNNSSDINS